MESWNQLDLCKPSNYTKVYSRQDLESVDSATKSIIISNKLESTGIKDSEKNSPEKWLLSLIDILKTAQSNIANVDPSLKYESKYLCAFTYQTGLLKKEKSIQAIKKVGKCLKRWSEVDLRYLISDVLEMIPTDFFFLQSVRLPSTHCMYYLLQRLVAAFHLLLQCVSYCMETAVYFRMKIISKHFFTIATLGYGIVGRVRALSLDLAESLAVVNDKLYPYVMAMVQTFPHDGKTEILPHNLMQELTNFGLEMARRRKTTTTVKSKKRPGKVEKLDSDSVTPEEEMVEEATVHIEENPEENEANSGSQDFKFNISSHAHSDDDVGEQISHEKFELLRRLSQNVIETSGGRADKGRKANGQTIHPGQQGSKSQKRKRAKRNTENELAKSEDESALDRSRETSKQDEMKKADMQTIHTGEQANNTTKKKKKRAKMNNDKELVKHCVDRNRGNSKFSENSLPFGNEKGVTGKVAKKNKSKQSKAEFAKSYKPHKSRYFSFDSH